jgi:hypothetical protein
MAAVVVMQQRAERRFFYECARHKVVCSLSEDSRKFLGQKYNDMGRQTIGAFARFFCRQVNWMSYLPGNCTFELNMLRGLPADVSLEIITVCWERFQLPH